MPNDVLRECEEHWLDPEYDYSLNTEDDDYDDFLYDLYADDQLTEDQ